MDLGEISQVWPAMRCYDQYDYYSLDDNAGGRFTIDANSGVVTVLDGSLLNYESATSHSITIRATSADASFSTQSFTINLTDVNEGAVGAVSDNNGASNYVLENAANGTTVGITGLANRSRRNGCSDLQPR